MRVGIFLLTLLGIAAFAQARPADPNSRFPEDDPDGDNLSNTEEAELGTFYQSRESLPRYVAIKIAQDPNTDPQFNWITDQGIAVNVLATIWKQGNLSSLGQGYVEDVSLNGKVGFNPQGPNGDYSLPQILDLTDNSSRTLGHWTDAEIYNVSELPANAYGFSVLSRSAYVSAVAPNGLAAGWAWALTHYWTPSSQAGQPPVEYHGGVSKAVYWDTNSQIHTLNNDLGLPNQQAYVQAAIHDICAINSSGKILGKLNAFHPLYPEDTPVLWANVSAAPVILSDYVHAGNLNESGQFAGGRSNDTGKFEGTPAYELGQADRYSSFKTDDFVASFLDANGNPEQLPYPRVSGTKAWNATEGTLWIKSIEKNKYVGVDLNKRVSWPAGSAGNSVYPVASNNKGPILTVINDPNVNAVVYGMLVPINISFQAHGDNEPLGDNKKKVSDEAGNPKDEWMPGNGKRVFPDAKNPGENRRDTVDVKVSIGIPNIKVYLLALDVDDPTPLEVDTDPESGQTNVIDENDGWILPGAGEDNRSGPPRFTPIENAQIECTTDENGVAKIGGALPQLRVGMHPGDNYRIAVTVLNSDGLDDLQTEVKGNAHYVSASEEQPSGFNGVVSPMLTVWRKLHVEQDSMLWPNPKPAPDRQVATGGVWGTGSAGAGTVTAITCNIGQSVVANFYEGGRVVSGNVEYKIRKVDAHLAGSSGIKIKLDHTLSAAEQAAFDLSSFEVYDDDDKPLPAGQAAPLPRQNLLNNPVKVAFQPAYVDMVEGPASYNSTDVSFLLNRTGNSLGNGVEGKAALPNSNDYWACTLTAGYQGPEIGDLEPGIDNQGAFAETDTIKGISLIYLEQIREASVISPIPNEVTLDEEHFNTLLWRVVAHEIGHCPLSHGEVSDHSEGGLMNPFNLEATMENPIFGARSIDRMRDANSWRK